MKKIAFVAILLTAFAFNSIAQKPRTFEVEKLDIIPTQWEPMMTYEQALKNLIQQDIVGGMANVKAFNKQTFNIVAKSDIPGPILNYQYTSFFDGLYFAYANHRPFTLSPDMIWLLISQGFANHVTNNAEELRSLFVDYKGQTDLIVINNNIDLNNPNSPWEQVFPELGKQIAKNTGSKLTDAITADFSTTTAITKVASQITLMKAMSPYFNYNVMTIGCGIPSITLEGTTKDWEKVLAKTEALRKYKLDWWVDELEPQLKQFIAASKGKVDKDFWKAMFKIHEQGRCGTPTTIDGWIVKFFPYNKFGLRNNLQQISTGTRGSVPDEIVKVDLKYTYLDGTGNTTVTPLELWAGFVGLKEDPKTFNLTPVIGWMIRKKDETATPSSSMSDLLNQHVKDREGINITVTSVPPELMKVGPLKRLTISFTNNITIPDEMAKVPIAWMWLYGKITPKERDRVVAMFPNTSLYINSQQYGKPDNHSPGERF